MEQNTKTAEDAARMQDADNVLKANNYDQARLVPILQQVQEKYRWLSKEMIAYIANAVGLPVARVYGVATFYAHFALTPKGKHIIKLCDGTACHVKGSMNVLDEIRSTLGLKEGQNTTDDMLFTVETVSCLGACGLAPVVVIGDDVHGQLKPGQINGILNAVIEKEKKGE